MSPSKGIFIYDVAKQGPFLFRMSPSSVVVPDPYMRIRNTDLEKIYFSDCVVGNELEHNSLVNVSYFPFSPLCDLCRSKSLCNIFVISQVLFSL